MWKCCRRIACVLWSCEILNADGQWLVPEHGAESRRESCHQSIRRTNYSHDRPTMNNNQLFLTALCDGTRCALHTPVVALHTYINMSCLAHSQAVTSETPDADDWGWGKAEGMCEVTQLRETKRLPGRTTVALCKNRHHGEKKHLLNTLTSQGEDIVSQVSISFEMTAD